MDYCDLLVDFHYNFGLNLLFRYFLRRILSTRTASAAVHLELVFDPLGHLLTELAPLDVKAGACELLIDSVVEFGQLPVKDQHSLVCLAECL